MGISRCRDAISKTYFDKIHDSLNSEVYSQEEMYFLCGMAGGLEMKFDEYIASSASIEEKKEYVKQRALTDVEELLKD